MRRGNGRKKIIDLVLEIGSPPPPPPPCEKQEERRHR